MKTIINTILIMAMYITWKLEQSVNAIKDNGINGKALEIAIRAFITGRIDYRVKTQGKTDIRFTGADGKRYTAEIKTACGEIETAEKSQFIFYCPIVDVDFPAELQTYVFTREQWKQFINGYTGNGKFIRYDSKRNHAHIQSFYVSEDIRPKASKAIRQYIDDTCFELPTVYEFFDFRRH